MVTNRVVETPKTVEEVLKGMTDSEKQEVKDKIGRVVLNHLKLLTIRIILKKEPA